jgi:hypothetical protein
MSHYECAPVDSISSCAERSSSPQLGLSPMLEQPFGPDPKGSIVVGYSSNRDQSVRCVSERQSGVSPLKKNADRKCCSLGIRPRARA